MQNRRSQLAFVKALRSMKRNTIIKFFERRDKLRAHEDFQACVILVIVICYRMRYIHPVHIATIFSWTIEDANLLMTKMLGRNYLKLAHVEPIGIGMTIGGHGHYLACISRTALKNLMRFCPYYMAGIRVRQTLSPKIGHDLVALLLALKTADIVNAIDLVPDYCSGISYGADDKIPDIYLRTSDGKIVWIEAEYSAKSGNELRSFCSRTIDSIREGLADSVYIYVDMECHAKRYRAYLDAACGGDSRERLPQIRVLQSNFVRKVSTFGGEVPCIEGLLVRNFQNGHTPHALKAVFDKRRGITRNKESKANPLDFTEY